MSPHVVTCRFEVHAAEGALDHVARELRREAAGFPPEQLTLDVTRHRRSPMVSARLTGLAAAVDEVRRSVPDDPSVRVLNDWLDVPPDHVYPDRRALLRIDPLERSRNERGKGERVVVAIVDSGITIDHPDLGPRLWSADIGGRLVHGMRCMDGQQDYDVTDQDGHGTMLAGAILATANRVEGLELMAVKFFDVITQPIAANAAAAIRSAVARRPDIINLSFDLGIGSNELQAAFRSACYDTDALIVIAAGNTGSDDDQYPLVPVCYADECRDKTIVVMATDWYDGKPIFSNFGQTSVDLAAPGVGIVSTRPPVSRDSESKKYGRFTGTSAAAAHVSGAAALLKSQYPRRTAREIKRLLMSTVDRSPWLRCVSGGRLNLGRAV